METQIYEDVKNALQALASQLGTGVETFWPEFVKVQIAQPIGGILLLIAGSVSSYFIFRFYKIAYEKDLEAPLTIFGGAIAAVFFLLGLVLLVEGFPCLFSPEYCALKEVLQMVNPL